MSCTENRRSTLSRRRLRRLAALALVGVLSGCAAVPGDASRATSGSSATAPGPTRTAAPTSTPTPTPTPTMDPDEAAARAKLATMTLEQKAGSVLMLHAGGTDPAALRGSVDSTLVGGLLLLGDNVPADTAQLAAQNAALSADPAFPVLTAIDEEGGIVTRLPADTAAGADTLQALPVADTAAAFTERGALLAASGIDVNFGIVADVTADPGSFIHPRVLGTDPAGAADRVAAAVTAERGVVLSTLKHFPGHGRTGADSHTSVPAIGIGLDEWRASDALPFRAGIEAGAEFVMTGHLQYSAVDALPASLSPRWIGVLRDELGFDGVVVTDDLRMLQDSGDPRFQDPAANVVAALAAGNTLVLTMAPVDPAVLRGAIVAAVADGRLSAEQLDAAALRLLELRHELGADGGR